MGGSFTEYILLYGICVYIVRSHRGEVSHKDYSFTEYEFAVCSRGGENSPGIFLRNINAVCSHGGEFSHQDCSFLEDMYTVSSHGGEGSPGIFLRNIYMSCVVTG